MYVLSRERSSMIHLTPTWEPVLDVERKFEKEKAAGRCDAPRRPSF